MKYSIVGDGSHIDINKGGEPRTSGVHLSGVIRYLAQQMGLLTVDDNEVAGAGFPLDARLKMSVGLAWENWLAAQYPEVMYHPGEIIHEGIIMSPDGLHPNETLYEFKATWKSMKKLLAEGYGHKSFWMWRAQNMGYLEPMGWLKTRQIILYVNGAYQGVCPEFVELDVEYTRQEVADNWALMQKHKHKAVAESH